MLILYLNNERLLIYIKIMNKKMIEAIHWFNIDDNVSYILLDISNEQDIYISKEKTNKIVFTNNNLIKLKKNEIFLKLKY